MLNESTLQATTDPSVHSYLFLLGNNLCCFQFIFTFHMNFEYTIRMSWSDSQCVSIAITTHSLKW